MSDEKPQGLTGKPEESGVNRRTVLVAGATSLVGVGVGAFATREFAAKQFTEAARGQAPKRAQTIDVSPGDLDEYYGFSSSGQTGEIRIIGMPSIASIASSEWLVTTSWDRAARSFARSAKHSAP